VSSPTDRGDDTAARETWFAPAGRASDDELRHGIEHCSTHPMIGTIMQSFGGVLAVLNRERQILALNHSLLDLIGVDDPTAALGVRPGEALDCVHQEDHPGGCGTSKVCSTCGAAIAIVACQREDEIQEAECVLTVEREDANLDMYFKVRVSPLHMDGQHLLVLFLEDISAERRRAALERTFFHDLGNTLLGLQGTVDLLSCRDEARFHMMYERLQRLSDRLTREVQLQRSLARAQPEAHRVVPRECTVVGLLQELEAVADDHPAARMRVVQITPADPAWTLRTDPVLVSRVLTNMLLNALEASDAGEAVKVRAERDDGGVTFHVWNRTFIPDAIAPRIFQRYFSTKPGAGRGTGTYAMKLIGERYLLGKVDFTTDRDEGTTFRLWLPELFPPR